AKCAGEPSGDRDERQLIPRVTISVTDDDDEENHRREPGVKNARVSCRSCGDRAGDSENEQNWRERGGEKAPNNFQIPRKIFDAKSAGAEKVVRIKFL